MDLARINAQSSINRTASAVPAPVKAPVFSPQVSGIGGLPRANSVFLLINLHKMARIYKPDQYDSVFRPQIQSQGFAREEAYDPSRQIEQDYKRRVQDVKNVARSASRQAGLDQQRIQLLLLRLTPAFATLGVCALSSWPRLYGARQMF